MPADRLRILHVSPLPPSPPRFGAQARIHGLMRALGRRAEVTAVALADERFDAEESRRAMQEYCAEVVLLPNPRAARRAKRLLQLRSLLSPRSFEHHLYTAPGLQRTLDGLLGARPFDVVALEFPYLAHLNLRQSPEGKPPRVFIDAHEIAYDLVRQYSRNGSGAARRVYAGLDWPKLRREERAAFAGADGIYVCSEADRRRVLEESPASRTEVIPNAADVDYFQPRPTDPPADGETVLFFGLLSTFPNVDGIVWFVREIWPRIAARRPAARLRVLGKEPAAEVRALAGPGVEIVGFAEDLRPHLAAASAVVVPLRFGAGTRLKIVESMAMGRPVVSTNIGAEGIDAAVGREILLADEPGPFAAAVLRLLDEPALAAQMGAAGRRLAVERYAWEPAAARLDGFMREVLACA